VFTRSYSMAINTVHKSILIWYSPQEMFLLVTQVDQYPKFLPGCDRARVVSRDGLIDVVEIGINLSGIHLRFVTRNLHVPDRKVSIALVNGPFSGLEGEWNFVPLGDPAQRACKVDFLLNYSFDSPALDTLVGPVLDKIASSMVDAFVKRAEAVYGD
jgi:ribosome-associated toxin RatA of RatAB toxin-antitoxin module